MASAATRSVYSALVGGIGSHDRGHIHHRSGQYAAVHQPRRMGGLQTARRDPAPRIRALAWALTAAAVALVLGAATRLVLLAVSVGRVSGRVGEFLGSGWHLVRSLSATALGLGALCSSARSAPLSGARSGSCKRSVSVSAHRRSPTSTSPCGNCRCSPSLEPDRSRTAPSLTSCSSRRRPQPPRQEHLAQDRARESSRPGPAHRRQPW